MNPELLTIVNLCLTSVVFGVSGTCMLGTYGDNCKRNCSRYCASEVDDNIHCDEVSGRCSEGCVPGWHGDQCIHPCSSNCINRTCNQQTGHCTQGCMENYSGDHCERAQTVTRDPQKRNTPETSGTNPIIAAIITPIVLAIIIITIGAVVWQRKHSHSNDRNQDRIRLSDWPDESTLFAPRDDKQELEAVDLHTACNKGNLFQVKQLLSQDQVDIDSRGSDGRTAVMLAAYWGHRAIFNTIMTRNPDVSVLDPYGNNILHLASCGGEVSIVKCVLSEKMADINSRNDLGETPVMKAAAWGHSKLFSLLLVHQPDMSQEDTAGNNVLHWACRGGDIAIVNQTLSQNIPIDSRGHDGKTPAMMAAENGLTHVLELLKSKGADLSLKDNFSNDAYQLARNNGHEDITEGEPAPRHTSWPCAVI